MTEKKVTAGQQIVQHDAERLPLEDDIIEYRRLMEADIMRQIYATAQSAKTKDLYLNKDFYIVLVTTVDRVLRTTKFIIFARKSCPTPVYKQSVWKYKHTTDTLEFLWSIPDALLYYHIYNNRAKYLQDKECADLTKFVVLMESGELLEWVKKENGEKVDVVIKISPKDSPTIIT